MSKIKYICGGFKTGMLLQAGGIGPVCLLLFQLPAFLPVPSVLTGVLGVALADSLYIFLAAAGIAPLVRKIKAADRVFNLISSTVLILLGIFFISMAGNQAPVVSAAEWLEKNMFLGMFVLTLMNPATIIVFTGIFTAELLSRKMNTGELFLFAFGTLLTTPVFLGCVVILGAFGSAFFPAAVIKGLNITVGTVLVYWGATCFFPGLKIKKTAG